MWKSIRTTNALENLNREFQTPDENPSVVLQRGVRAVASGQIQLRRIDGYQRLSEVLEHAQVAA